MTTFSPRFRRPLRRSQQTQAADDEAGAAAAADAPPVEIPENDPLLAYVTQARGTVELEGLELESPALRELRAAGVVLVVPLLSQGELVGMLNLGPRLSEQAYSRDDRKLLEDLAAHAAPAVRVAQLVRQQQIEVQERSRIDQELKVATLIQQQFLPRELPTLKGWHVATHYQPAREVGGDFYDFIELPNGNLGIVVGDVTDKGVPAALIMAKTHSILRGDAPRLIAPGKVLARANEVLVDEVPANMFVTCLFAVLDPVTGRLRYANAGHPLPYLRRGKGVVELRATGMPLGLLPDMVYEEAETTIAPGDRMLLHSDGIAETHGPGRELFGFPRLADLVRQADHGDVLIDNVLAAVASFGDSATEQEDDITLVMIERNDDGPSREHLLDQFEVRSVPGNERLAMDRVTAVAQSLQLPARRAERLGTAVSEATMNAIEHGNRNRADLPVEIRLLVTEHAFKVQITDQGEGAIDAPTQVPDIDAKLAGRQDPRGWGLFLIKSMVDEMSISSTGGHQTLELVMHLEGGA